MRYLVFVNVAVAVSLIVAVNAGTRAANEIRSAFAPVIAALQQLDRH